MLRHPLKYSEKLSGNDIESILTASLKVLEGIGMVVQSEHICRTLEKAGAKVDKGSNRIFFESKMVQEYLKHVPSKWTFYARNPERNVEVGGKNLLVAPGYGSAFIADSRGKRRNANIQDLKKLVLMAGNNPEVDITGGLLVEPNDIAIPLRPLEITQTLVRNSDKPFMGSVAGETGAKESLEIARIIFGNIKDKPCVVGLININSPMRLDQPMAEALVEYTSANQPILLTPGILMGITSPVTVIGAMVQAYAELLGCVTIAQVIKPSVPVIVGLGGFGSDLRNGSTGFGRSENALGIHLGAEIARKLNIPFRCSAAVTGSRIPDCRSGYERMMTAMAAYNAGAHFCLQAVGILDSINTMSYEQYVIDLEIWSYIGRFARPVIVDQETLALDVINGNSEGLLIHEHTLKHMRNELHVPALASAETYEDWWANSGPDVVSQASEKAKQMLKNLSRPAIDEDVDEQLRKYVERRRKILKQVC